MVIVPMIYFHEISFTKQEGNPLTDSYRSMQGTSTGTLSPGNNRRLSKYEDNTTITDHDISIIESSQGCDESFNHGQYYTDTPEINTTDEPGTLIEMRRTQSQEFFGSFVTAETPQDGLFGDFSKRNRKELLQERHPH